MDPYVRRLVERLNDPARPLSRNRHFHTFDTPEGRTALRLSRRLRSLQRDILACFKDGRAARVSRREGDGGALTVELHFQSIGGWRMSVLQPGEYELLAQLPGVSEALLDERPAP